MEQGNGKNVGAPIHRERVGGDMTDNSGETPLTNVSGGGLDDDGMPSWAKFLINEYDSLQRLFNRLTNMEANTSMIWASLNKTIPCKQPLSCPPRLRVDEDDISDGDDSLDEDANIILDISSDDDEVGKKITRRKKKVTKKHAKKDSPENRTGGSSKVNSRSGIKKKHSPTRGRPAHKVTTTNQVGHPQHVERSYSKPHPLQALPTLFLQVQNMAPRDLGVSTLQLHFMLTLEEKSPRI
ncbi:hypothetical protein SESBI_26839 [Sesbania bispinosa]|nr:hypothetical protein SESBI_26839 [Sesbania bispinosa]